MEENIKLLDEEEIKKLENIIEQLKKATEDLKELNDKEV